MNEPQNTLLVSRLAFQNTDPDREVQCDILKLIVNNPYNVSPYNIRETMRGTKTELNDFSVDTSGRRKAPTKDFSEYKLGTS